MELERQLLKYVALHSFLQYNLLRNYTFEVLVS